MRFTRAVLSSPVRTAFSQSRTTPIGSVSAPTSVVKNAPDGDPDKVSSVLRVGQIRYDAPERSQGLRRHGADLYVLLTRGRSSSELLLWLVKQRSLGVVS
jgi:hypothetical protein